MAKQLLYSFLINGVECLSYILENSLIERSAKNIAADKAILNILLTVDDVVSLTNGQTVVISRGVSSSTENYIFRGNIKSIEKKNSLYTIECHNNLKKLDKLLFSKSYDKNIDTEAGEGSAIASDIITDGGLTPAVVATGTSTNDLIIDKFISKRESRLSKLNLLNIIYKYKTREDYNNQTIIFEPEGNTFFSTTLVVGSNVYNMPKFEDEIISMRNKIYVDGAFEEDTRVESFNGDGSTATFTLSYTPETVDLKVGGVQQKLGITGGSVTGYDFTMDKELKTFTFESGSIPATGTDNIVMTYTVKEPYTTIATSQDSIDFYGLTQEESYSFKDLRTVEDSDNRALGLLDKLSFASKSTLIVTDEYLLEPGYKIPYSNPQDNIYDGEYIVQKVSTNYPDPFEKVIIGDGDFNVSDLLKSVNERLKLLEGDKSTQNEILRQIKELTSGIIQESRYLEVENTDRSGQGTGVFILNDIIYGVLGTQKLGDDGTGVVTITHRYPGNNIFKEFVYDTEFYDSASSTGITVDTTAYNGSSGQSITIAATTGVYVSELVAIGHSYNSCILEIGSASVSTSVTYQVSADGGSNYETVTLGNSHTFTNTSTAGVIIKITNANASALVINNTYNEVRRYVLPAIKLTLV